MVVLDLRSPSIDSDDKEDFLKAETIILIPSLKTNEMKGTLWPAMQGFQLPSNLRAYLVR